MRVISGRNRGTKLIAPPGTTTRPTDDRLKENIFNLIGVVERESSVLDLFAGSGQIGIEFLSRGSKNAVFVEKNIRAVKVIKENLIKTKNMEYSNIVQSDVKTFLQHPPKKRFRYVYIDPPYDDKKILKEVFNFLKKSDIIDTRTWIVIETVADVSFDEENIVKERVYGSRKIIILEVNNDSDLSGQF